jgi:hypothetical protein
MENFLAIFPQHGKLLGEFSTAWKTFTIIPQGQNGGMKTPDLLAFSFGSSGM